MPSRPADSARGSEFSSFRLKRGVPSLADYAAERMKSLCVAAGLGSEAEQMSETFRDLLLPWGDAPIGARSDWVSEISDDNTPVEFSVALSDDKAEVRALFEPQGERATIASYRAAGLAFSERLEREFGANLGRLRTLQDLLLPGDMVGPFAIWYSVIFSANRRPSFKAYLNPQARGATWAESLVKDTLVRLGLGRTWPLLGRTIMRRGTQLDEPKYIALDLTSEANARIKVYVRHHDAFAEDLEIAASAAQNHVANEVVDFTRTMRAADDRMAVRAPFTCTSFVGTSEQRPVSVTTYIPVCAYAHDDAAVQQRVREYMSAKGLDSSLYDAITTKYANRRLDAGVGMQSWIALRRYQSKVRLTVYLATEANRVYAPGEVPAPTSLPLITASGRSGR